MAAWQIGLDRLVELSLHFIGGTIYLGEIARLYEPRT